MTKDTDTKKAKPATASDQTPSGLALATVGDLPKNATEEELVAHADKYMAALLKARRG